MGKIHKALIIIFFTIYIVPLVIFIIGDLGKMYNWNPMDAGDVLLFCGSMSVGLLAIFIAWRQNLIIMNQQSPTLDVNDGDRNFLIYKAGVGLLFWHFEEKDEKGYVRFPIINRGSGIAKRVDKKENDLVPGVQIEHVHGFDLIAGEQSTVLSYEDGYNRKYQVKLVVERIQKDVWKFVRAIHSSKI